MKKILFSLLVVAAALVGCTREIEPEGSTVVPVSKYLVINADCAPMTKTDINEGKSTWVAGDKITVLYNGEAYEYVAGTPSEDGKQTYFTSTAGITDYDGTGLVAYYEALSAEDGTVGIAAERDIEFFDLAQKNPACAPLVGYTNAETLDNGVINMHFENIFSVIELRIDPAGSQMTSPMKTLKIEPAEGSEFEGYITCSGVVDVSTLALETLQTGNVLTLNFPDQADARVAQIIKFPVGRFSSSKGLKVTLTLEDGSELVKNIYKSGITTFSESDGRFSVQHLAKAMYAFSGGIGCAQDLVDFAAAVNNGGSLIEYMNDEGKIVLLDDIDMSGVTDWTPIGNGTFTGVVSGTEHKSSYTGKAFTGHFDGQWHSIRNIKLSADLSGEGSVYGLFGIVDGAVIENVTLGAAENDNSELTFSADATTDAAVLAGVCFGSEIRNCVNYVPMHNEGNSTQNEGTTNVKRTTAAAFAGFVYSDASKASVLDNLVNHGSITVNMNKNTSNGASSVMGAGIVGEADALINGALGNTISNCVNYGNMTSDAPRTSGIIAAANNHTLIEKCVNYGDQTNSNSGTRVGLISCVIANDCTLSDCENYGDAVMTASGTGAQVGGLLCLVNNAAAKVTGGGNYGSIITNATTRGLLIANITNASKVDGIVAGGSIGSYNGGEYSMVELTTANYMDYIGVRSATMASKVTNIIFNGPDATGIRTADDLMEFATLVNAGSSTAKFEQNGVVVLLNDIDMTGKSWTPIGKANTVVGGTNAALITGKAFTGHFNGNGFSIKNLKLVSSSSTAGDNYGFFGTLGSGAVVENLNFDSSCSLDVTATASVASGVLAGYMYDAIVRNVTSHAPMTFNGKAGDDVFMSIAMIGQSYANTIGSVIENCHNYGEIKAYNSDNTKNGGTCYHAAGIVGYTMAPTSATAVTTVSECTNRGNMTSGLARTAGIVGAATRGAAITKCVNYGDQVNDFYRASTARLGGIICMGGYSHVTIADCINYGDITSTTKAIVGGIVCAHQSGTPTGCENYGVILTDHASRGLLQGYDMADYATKWSNCIAGGLVGTYNGDIPSYDVSWNTNGNPVGYLGAATNGSTFTDITYKIDTLDPNEEEKPASLNVLFIGNSFTQDAVTHLPGILAAAGIDNVKMTHMYYGGCTMSVYNAEWATKTNFICFECKPGGRTWSPSTGKTLKEVTESRQWDIVSIQESTGNNATWVWDDADKTNIDGVIAHIRESQVNAKIYFLLAQAYQNMEKIAADIRGDVNWGVDYNTAYENKSAETILAEQIGMYEVIVKFGKGVINNCAVEGLIPTGTALQNLRTTSYNNSLGLSRDGYHMDYGLARYSASCAVFETLFAPRFGASMSTNSFRYARTGTGYTPVTDASATVALQAARYALKWPFQITNMSDSPVGISSATDFYEFLTAVSDGKSLYKWTGTDGEVNLLSDVNLSSITAAQWQTLADKNLAVCQDGSCLMTGNAFEGVFDGNGNTVSGFNPTVTLAKNGSFGLLCLLEGATVKNLNVSGTMTVSATEQAVAGMLAGAALNSTIKDVTVSGKIVSSGTTVSKRFSIGGVCGFAFSTGGNMSVSGCTSNVTAEIDCGSNTGNGAASVMYGGIVGMASAPSDVAAGVTLAGCTNNGDMNLKAGRASGIIATCFRNVTLDKCINNGDQSNAIENGRLGNVVSYVGGGSKLVGCVNNGNIEATDASYGGTIAGVAALVATGSDVTVEGGGNYGNVTAQRISDNGKWKGLVVANFGGASMKNVVVSGKMFYAGSQLDINASNFTGYVCGNYDASKMTGLTYVAPAKFY